MADCISPLTLYDDSREGGGLLPHKQYSKFGYAVKVPCKRCIPCRMNYASDWSTRILCEQQMHDYTSFITLTYNNENLPANGNLIKNHFQTFIRSLRKRTGIKIRYYMCGEYGEKTKRPHFHAILFGYDFPDKTRWRYTRGNKIFRSELLEKTWTKGNSEIGECTQQSAAYVARYVMKKQYGPSADIEYGVHYDIKTRQKLYIKQPEYTNMSNCPGIGQSFYDKYWGDIFPNDSILLNGKRRPAPKFFRDQLKETHPHMHALLKQKRIDKFKSVPIKERTRITKVRKILTEQQHKRQVREL